MIRIYQDFQAENIYDFQNFPKLIKGIISVDLYFSVNNIEIYF